MEKIGLIPAAGIAKRLGPLAFSKELLPISFKASKKEPGLKAVSTYLLEKFHRAGVKKVFTVIRKGKWDIPNYYGDGSEIGIQLAYLIMAHPFGVPYTLDQAYSFVKTSKIFLGFPDVLFEPQDAFSEADAAFAQKGADIVLGLYPVKDKRRMQRTDFGHLFTDFHYIDVGNPDDLAQALREYFVEST